MVPRHDQTWRGHGVHVRAVSGTPSHGPDAVRTEEVSGVPPTFLFVLKSVSVSCLKQRETWGRSGEGGRLLYEQTCKQKLRLASLPEAEGPRMVPGAGGQDYVCWTSARRSHTITGNVLR